MALAEAVDGSLSKLASNEAIENRSSRSREDRSFSLLPPRKGGRGFLGGGEGSSIRGAGPVGWLFFFFFFLFFFFLPPPPPKPESAAG